MNNIVISLLEAEFGIPDFKSKGNLAFFCPFCKHYKKKLEVHPELEKWNCWVCGTKGKSLVSLFRKKRSSQDIIERISKISKYKPRDTDNYKYDSEEEISLPESYVPLWNCNLQKFYYKNAVDYLLKRNLDFGDIIKYNLGVCTSGQYYGMIIFPNYNKEGKLTYFSNRSFLNSNSAKFINPPHSRNVVGFELQLNYDEPITLCESALDAIVIKHNSSPLYGKFLSDSLKLKIIEHKVDEINICLDLDALKHALEVCEYFISIGIKVNLVKMPVNQDPSSLGHEKTWSIINGSKRVNSLDILKEQIYNKLG